MFNYDIIEQLVNAILEDDRCVKTEQNYKSDKQIKIQFQKHRFYRQSDVVTATLNYLTGKLYPSGG
jgi:hypothetical protein